MLIIIVSTAFSRKYFGVGQRETGSFIDPNIDNGGTARYSPFKAKAIELFFLNQINTGELYVKNTFTLVVATAIIAIAALGCNMSTTNMSSFKTTKDKDGKTETTNYKAGETIYADAVVSNAAGKTTVKFSVVADDSPSYKKGETIPGSEVKVELPSSGTAQYSLPLPAGFKSGKFTVNAEMLDDKGEKKDAKTVAVSVEGGPAAPPAEPHKDNKKTDKDDDN
jgi:hypothetical protein